jgi:hypothetical protein
MDSSKTFYYSLYNPDNSSDHLSNAAYKIIQAEPNYTLLVTLYKILPKDVIQFIVEYSPLFLNLAGRTLRRLDASIDKCMFDDFKTIYDNEYMAEPNICNFFEFSEVNPYHLCECTKYKVVQISRNFYIKECRCQNGKRYLAFKMVFNAANRAFSINFLKKVTDKIDVNIDIFQRMIDYIIDSGPIDTEYLPIYEPKYY